MMTVSVGFPIIDNSHLEVYFDGVEQTSGWSFDGSDVTFTITVPSGTAGLIRRVTPQNSLLPDWSTGAKLEKDNLTKMQKQLLYLQQESADTLTLGGALVKRKKVVPTSVPTMIISGTEKAQSEMEGVSPPEAGTYDVAVKVAVSYSSGDARLVLAARKGSNGDITDPKESVGWGSDDLRVFLADGGESTQDTWIIQEWHDVEFSAGDSLTVTLQDPIATAVVVLQDFEIVFKEVPPDGS